MGQSLLTLMWANILTDPAPKFANKYPSRERRKRVRVFEFAKISQESENEN